MSGPRSKPADPPSATKADESVSGVAPSGSSNSSSVSRLSFISNGIRALVHGEIGVGSAASELVRRVQVAAARRRERSMLDELASQQVELRAEFATRSGAELLEYFRARTAPAFLPGFEEGESMARVQRDLFPEQTGALLDDAQLIMRHRWPLLGFGEKNFGASINWHRDPLSGRIWPLEYHAAIPLWHDDGSDIRVLWELNRLGHLITLGRAYAVTADEKLAAEFFKQIEGWREQNPVARGANWACAMEVALRAMNLLAALALFRKSPELTAERLLNVVVMLEQHGKHIERNLEFSHLGTSNHYLSDVVGLLWLGIMLPELSAAAEWRQWAMTEMLREMDKQILPDGADYEASTGYHRFVLELFLYSFVLCDNNNIPIEEKYWQKLRAMFGYLRALLRPDGKAPLVGDTDGGQVIPIVRHAADDHAYLLAIGAVIFEEPGFKLPRLPAPEELLWTLGAEIFREYEKMTPQGASLDSHSFPDAGTYLLRKDDLYLLFNLSGSGGYHRGSHGHNDALSIEVSACGRAFLVDAGVYVYTADLRERHLFRSTAYHSTIQVDNAEQNSMREDLPFAIGNEAHPTLLEWETTPERDYVYAEHSGYARLPQPVIHRRSITFDKPGRWWLIEDEVDGDGEHDVTARFHFDAGLEVEIRDDGMVEAWDKMKAETGPRLFVIPVGVGGAPQLEEQFTSRHYGSKLVSVTAAWTMTVKLPWKVRWAIVPVGVGEDERDRLTQTPGDLKFEI